MCGGISKDEMMTRGWAYKTARKKDDVIDVQHILCMDRDFYSFIKVPACFLLSDVIFQALEPCIITKI